jgi:hypothetical protein
MYIAELKINGQIRTLNFNNYGREALARFYGKDPLTIQAELAQAWSESLLILAADCVYWGLVGDYRANRKTVDFTIQDVSAWLQYMEDEELAPVISVFLNSIKDRLILVLNNLGKAQVQEQEDDEKKNTVGKS